MTLTSEKKEAAGRKAAEFIENGMLVGLGTGSTAAFFIEALIERVREGLRIEAVSSSERSLYLAKQGGIKIRDLNEVGLLDVTVDGADQIDKKKQMIKGGGGAHLREKIVAFASREMIVIIDDSKVVDRLGGIPLPLEVAHFGWKHTKRHLAEAGFYAIERLQDDRLYETDNGNMILDLPLNGPVDDPVALDSKLRQIPGVLETGFFFGIAGKVIIGEGKGRTTIRD